MNGKTKECIKECFVELCNDLILLQLVNFHKYVSSLANEIAKCNQIGTSKRQRRHKREGLVKTQTCDAKRLPVLWATYKNALQNPATTGSSADYPKMDDRGASVGGHDYKWHSNTSNDWQPCRLPKLDNRGASVGSHNHKCPSNASNHLQPCRLPSWTIEEHQLGVTTTNGLQTPPTTAAVLVT